MKYLVIICAIALASCVTQKKVDKWNAAHPEQEARNCAEKYPCTITGTDTTILHTDSTAWLQAMQEMNGTIDFLNELNDSLLRVIMTDTLCRQYQKALARMKAENEKLRSQADVIPPIPFTIQINRHVLDTAALSAARLAQARQVDEISRISGELTKRTHQSKVRLWMFIAATTLCLLLLAIIVLLLRSKNILSFKK